MGHGWLAASSFCFLVGFGYTMHALGAQHYRPSRLNFIAIFCGFLFQSAFLFERGHELARCPLTNLFEVLIFLCWSIVLLYLLVGPAYRLSLLGAFTSPLVFVLQNFALLAPIDLRGAAKSTPNPWLETHAALSVIAYGAFALACVAGAMYLTQERQLKTHHIHSIFFHLPPIADLAIAIQRLLLAGFVLLTVGLMAGFFVGQPALKIALGVGVWIVYAGILIAGYAHRISPRRVAFCAVLAFSFALSTLWGVNLLSTKL